MSSLFDQLSSSGGATSRPSSTSSSHYHGRPQVASKPRAPALLSSWEQKKNKFEKKWEATEARYRRDWGRTPTQSSDKNKRPQKNQQPEVIDFKAYRPTETSRPYAYEPAGNQMEWVRPTWQDVLKDLLWKLAESMIAAAGMALAEFFVHRRFHPGPGVRW